MKLTKVLCFVTALFTAALTSCFTTSCTKEKTIILRDTLVDESILRSVPWEIAEAMGVLGNTALRYEKNGTANNWNVAGDYYVFNEDNTGYMYDGVGARHAILNWQLFKNNDRVKLIMVYQNDIRMPNTTTITWDNLVFKNGNLQYSDYYRDAITGVYYHGQAIRSPRK